MSVFCGLIYLHPCSYSERPEAPPQNTQLPHQHPSYMSVMFRKTTRGPMIPFRCPGGLEQRNTSDDDPRVQSYLLRRHHMSHLLRRNDWIPRVQRAPPTVRPGPVQDLWGWWGGAVDGMVGWRRRRMDLDPPRPCLLEPPSSMVVNYRYLWLGLL